MANSQTKNRNSKGAFVLKADFKLNLKTTNILFAVELRKKGSYKKLEQSIEKYTERNAEKEEILAKDENIQEQIKVMNMRKKNLPNDSDSDSCRSFLLLKAIAKRLPLLFVNAIKSVKERQLLLSQ